MDKELKSIAITNLKRLERDAQIMGWGIGQFVTELLGFALSKHDKSKHGYLKPAEAEEKRPFSMWIETSTLRELDKIHAEKKWSRAAVVRALIESYLEPFEEKLKIK